MALRSLMLMALILAVGVIVTATAPVEPIDDWTVQQPEQQQEELTADGKERSARSLGFGVGLIGVGAGVSPFVGYPSYGYGGGYPYGYYGSRYPSYYGRRGGYARYPGRYY